MTKNLSNKITIINFLMTLIICAYHFPYGQYGRSYEFSLIKEFFGFLAMAIFFFLSGFLLYLNTKTKEDVDRKIHTRFFSLFIPYIIWNLIHVLKKRIFSGGIYTFNLLLSDFFTGPLNGATWYLLAVYILLAFMPLVVKYKQKKKTYTIILFFIIVLHYLKKVAILPSLFNSQGWWWYNNTLTYLPFYAIGAYIGLYYDDLNKRQDKTLLVNFISAFLFFSATLAQYSLNVSYLQPITKIIIPISFWFAMPTGWFKSSFKSLTSNAFYLYVMHIPFLVGWSNALIKLMFTASNYGLFQLILIALLSMLLMYIMATVVVTLLKLILVKWDNLFEILSGNRVKNDFSRFLRERKLKKEQNKETNMLQ